VILRNKILYICSAYEYSNSSAAIRNRKLIEFLSHDNDVYTLEVSYKNSERFLNDLHPYKKNRIIIPVDLGGRNPYAKTSSKRSFYHKAFYWLKNYIKFAVPDHFAVKIFSIYRTLISLANEESWPRFDKVIISSDPKGVQFLYLFPNFKSIGRSGCEFIQYWGDPWYGDVSSSNNVITKFIERLLLSRADRVLFNTSSTLKIKKLQHSRIASNFGLLIREPKISGEVKRISNYRIKNDLVNLIYAGDFFRKSRNIGALIKAVDNQACFLKIIGHGDHIENCPDNVAVTPRVNSLVLENEYLNSDILVVILNKQGSQFPGKIFDILGYERPILVLYENLSQIAELPFKSRFIFVKNREEDITTFVSETLSERVFQLDFTEALDFDYTAHAKSALGLIE